MFEKKKFDFYLFLPVLLLLIFSFGVISSVSFGSLDNHVVYALIAVVFFFFFSFLDMEVLFSLSPLIYVFCLAFLILPFVFGTVTRGSVRWIPIGDYTVQPSEIIKPFLCLFSAWFWSRKEYSWVNLAIFGAAFLLIVLLIFIQPDLGSTIVIISILAGGVIFSGISKKDVILILSIIVLFLPLLWHSLKSYQKTRFLHFLNPSSDPLGEGYNQIQAMIAVGSGKISGWGLGRGTQSHLAFLPERHTDFIFSSMAEEFGFVGSVFLLAIYLFLFLRMLKIADFCTEKGKFLAVMSLFVVLVFQTVVNIGMNIGLLPITGVTLPLFSYGGSSLMATMIGLGMIQNISRQNQESQTVSIRHF